LSADLIADAALALVDSGQPFGVNALARSLGVTPSSLYNHVDGRDAIIELMRGRLGSTYLTETPSGTWDEIVEATVRASRRMYAEHPFVIASYDNLATALLGAGFPDDEVIMVIAILDSFAIGFGLDLASPDDIWRPETPTTSLGRLLAVAPRGAERSDQVFETGLELLLDALRLRLGRLDLD
jgi:AcrR family transcriptional regulator